MEVINSTPLLILLVIGAFILGGAVTYLYLWRRGRQEHKEINSLRARSRGQGEELQLLQTKTGEQSERLEELEAERARLAGQVDTLQVTVEDQRSKIQEMENLVAEKESREKAAMEQLEEAFHAVGPNPTKQT